MEDEPIVIPTGSAAPATGPDDDDKDACPIATLWLPDPEAWRGWGIRHVWRKDEKKPPRRVGFR